MSYTFTRRQDLQFDLEQQIMQAWNTKEDLELFLERYMDDPKPMSEDEVHNVVYGIVCMHELRCQKAFKTFEDFLKELREERDGVVQAARQEALQEASDVVAGLSDAPFMSAPTESFRDRAVKTILNLS